MLPWLSHALAAMCSTVIKLGQDDRGKAIEAALKNENVGGGYIIHTAEAATGASVLISSHERNAAIFTFRGANSLIVNDDVPLASCARDVVYIASLSDTSADAYPFIVNQASEQGAFIASNPGIRQIAARGEAFHKVLPKLNVLSMNRDEAAALVPTLTARQRRLPGPSNIPDNAPELMRRGLSAGGFDMALVPFLQLVVGLGAKSVVVTDGHRGSYAANRHDVVYCPALPANVVGTAGAGDAFSATFCAYLCNGASLGEALQYASVNASSVVAFADAQSGLMAREPLMAEKLRRDAELSLRIWPNT